MDLKYLLTNSDNQICADCKCSNVSCASINLGVFLCMNCGGVHKDMGQDVKQIAMDLTGVSWSKDIMNRFVSTGNNSIINKTLECELPEFYQIPWHYNCPNIISRGFYRDKYISKSFAADSLSRGLQLKFSSLIKTIVLQKRLRCENKFVDRKFELIVDRNIIQYFINQSDTNPKAVIPIDDCDIFFVDHQDYEMPNNTAVMVFKSNRIYRFIFVCSGDGQALVNFYNNIRYAKYHRLCLNYAGFNLKVEPQQIAHLTHHPLAVGWLRKTGPSSEDSWRKRFCILLNRTLFYMIRPDDSSPKGTIFIGDGNSKNSKYSFHPSLPLNWIQTTGYPFTLTTPTRSYVFSAETEDELNRWQSAIEWILEEPLNSADLKTASFYEPKSFIDKIGNLFR